VPSAFQTCVPCSNLGGLGGQCYLNAPTVTGCIPGQPAQCVPCSFGGGIGQQCFVASPTTPGCVPGVPQQCIPCNGGIGGYNQCCRNPQNPFGASQPCSTLCPGQIPGQSPLCQLVPGDTSCLGGLGGLGQRCYPQSPGTPGCIDNPAAGITCVPCNGTGGGTYCRPDGIVEPGEQCDPLLTPGCDPLTCTFRGPGGIGGQPGVPYPGIPGVPGLPGIPGGGGTINPLPGVPGIGLPIFPIACDDRVEFDTRAGGVSLFNAYPSCGIPLQAGPENIFAFQTFFNAEVRVEIDDDRHSAVNFFVLADAPDPFRCIEADPHIGRFLAAAGRTYYIVADSETPFDAGAYRLKIDCDHDNSCDLFAGCGGYAGLGGGAFY
jgi:hypothetical protein